ncbi:MAG: phosphoribosylformylglycinamidine cyclo-ligase [Candidatus Brocadia sp. AMX2]|uniref:Phosphoribosylformylglycinamidine cyclo-ligase n=1 Tax=Candidatus Brocadia sinica JPN1 TaxID=1197129 RepID=A0ABQ0K275_9BACT|nr:MULTISPECIES: phosphoribosylformylglycinamidine cyclo-ligase [Brocadia]KXK33288.1 MAG: phosphoribosylformylglycinamidine cyclo-ligase [Candidatus Brocadia sinica]MBC6931566.1 phosphoribosylformylglycinamidine cyclo-ligase [Candidatus Brocadia sp.]MBL1169207.1 phosphoribosylformylglycinamidine cyclo-ligase [Candidatus Brocadia sp. AMX1]NOG42939.1 phosphoribosylformylglycinamidine cyclo-ligase [Planctomycetota bacterium]KAA0242487.1 MAG: phosphoribosylformylglycinamidine cyclo-ligase [Candida
MTKKTKKTTKGLSYRDAGVDIDTKGQFTTDIYSKMKTTFSPRVIENPDGFGGLFALNSRLKKYRQPVLVSSTDGVGTKLKIAFMMNKHDTIGIDLVAMCVNDIIVLGAEPLFLLDYLASSKIVPKVLHEVIDGIAEGCRQSGCALIGGETPEMPGFYHDSEYDIAGFVVGVVEKDKIINGKTIKPGDMVIGLSSSGIHSNGFSLVRKVFFDKAKMKTTQSLSKYGLNTTLGAELIKPTKIYVKSILKVLNKHKTKKIVKGMAHITGGGLLENIPRILPEGCAVQLERNRWDVPKIFDIIQNVGGVNDQEMLRVFNMGIGMVLMVSKSDAETLLDDLRHAKEPGMVIGEVTRGDRIVHIV